jgi:hypothetical protein
MSPQKIARRLPKRLTQLQQAALRFEAGQNYTEVEVNEILISLFDDHVFARRLLIEWGFLGRTTDGSRYWFGENRSSVRTTELEHQNPASRRATRKTSG